MEMVHFPGLLVARDANMEVREAMCGSIYTERELKQLTVNPLLVVSAGETEVIQFLGGLFRFYNNGVPLSSGSNMRLTFNNVIASGNIVAVNMRGETTTEYMAALPDVESALGVPLTLSADGTAPFTGGDNSSFILFLCLYRKTLML